MSKENKKKENGFNFKGIEINGTFWASMILLGIMVLSIAGFALSSGGGGSSSQNNQLPSELAFQQFEDPNTGTIFWGAIRNNEQFIFLNIENFDNRTDLLDLSERIKAQSSIEIYVDESFNSPESIYILDKTFRGLQMPTQKILNLSSCNANTLVLTTNNTLEGNCMVFESSLGKEYNSMENLVYFLIQ